MSTMIVLDMQGFVIDKEFIVKELATSNGYQIYHFIFKPPIDFRMLSDKDQTGVRYLEHFHHGLRYSEGFVNYEDLDNIICKILCGAGTVYVKGHQKYDFLNKISRCRATIINLEDQNPTKFEKETPKCMAHQSDSNSCSINNCEKLFQWLTDNNKNNNNIPRTNTDKWNGVFNDINRFSSLKCTSKRVPLNKIL